MLRVAAEVKNSSIHGRGLFATEFIPKGTVIWALDLGQDQILTVDEVLNADEETRHHWLTYAYYCERAGGYILCGDDARFVNHSEAPVIAGLGDSARCYALRDIMPGEEITEDYRTYDADPLQQWSNLLFDPYRTATAVQSA